VLVLSTNVDVTYSLGCCHPLQITLPLGWINAAGSRERGLEEAELRVCDGASYKDENKLLYLTEDTSLQDL
jgi:hypothetical protein